MWFQQRAVIQPIATPHHLKGTNMISPSTLQKLIAKGAKVHIVTYPASSNSQGWANHFATKAQADRELANSRDIWNNVLHAQYGTRPAADFKDVAHLPLV
jgi:hypothetical protein